MGQIMASPILLYRKDCKNHPWLGSWRFSWRAGAL